MDLLIFNELSLFSKKYPPLRANISLYQYSRPDEIVNSLSSSEKPLGASENDETIPLKTDLFGFFPFKIFGLFVTAYLQYRRGDQLNF